MKFVKAVCLLAATGTFCWAVWRVTKAMLESFEDSNPEPVRDLECPDCCEYVPAKARVCRYCGCNLTL